MPILDSEFNALTVTMSKQAQWEPFDGDPYPTLEAMAQDFHATGRLLISTLHCAHSIYGDPYVNQCGRAWHDYCHVLMAAEFDAEGEARAAWFQCLQVDNLCARKIITRKQADRFKRILHAEVNGQVEHYMRHGSFPANGYEFTKGYLECISK